MLYKNGEPYKLTSEEIKLHTKRQIYLMHSSLVKYDYKDQRLRKPNRLLIEPFYTLYDEVTGGSTELRYASIAPQKRIEGSVAFTAWTPSEIEFPNSGKLIIEGKNPEMNYFLANHPGNEANPGRPLNQTPVFFPENKAELARKAVLLQQKRFDAVALIFSPKDGLSDQDLRMVAKSYPDLVGFIDGWVPEQVKEALRLKAERDPEFFMRAAKSPKTRVKFIVNGAVSEKLLVYKTSSRTWYKRDGEEDKELIYTVKQNDGDPIDALIDFLMNKDKKEYLKYFDEKLQQDAVSER